MNEIEEIKETIKELEGYILEDREAITRQEKELEDAEYQLWEDEGELIRAQRRLDELLEDEAMSKIEIGVGQLSLDGTEVVGFEYDQSTDRVVAELRRIDE